MADDRLFHLVIGFRLIERAALTLSVVLACAWLAWKYLPETTKFDLSDERLSPLKISFVIGTPILIALLFVGYCYVDLSNPVEVRLADDNTKLAAVVAQSASPRDAALQRQALDDPTHIGATPKSAASAAPAAPSSEAPASGMFSFRGLSDGAATQASARRPPIGGAAERQALEDRARLDFELWTEQSLRGVFTTLANLPNPSRPTSDRVLNLSLAIGCLDSETFHPSRHIDTFVANKTFDQAEADVRQAVASKTFATDFCNTLKLEQ